MSDPQPYDHYRPTDADYADGVYRVVGTGDPVTMVVVADADGNRINPGTVAHVSTDRLDGFEPAENPDEGFQPGQILDGLIEEVRMVIDWVR
jgi:hypothetical protein